MNVKVVTSEIGRPNVAPESVALIASVAPRRGAPVMNPVL